MLQLNMRQKIYYPTLKLIFLDRSENIQQLEDSYISIKKINSIMNRMPEKCDPFIITTELDLIYLVGKITQQHLKALFTKE